MSQEPREVLVFEVAGQRYGLAVADVQELLRAVALTPLPRAPDVVEGAINLRGRAVPVLDLRRRFGLPPKPPEPADHLVVARAGGRLVALRVDRALDLARPAAEAVEDARAALPGTRYVEQVASFPDGLVLIHDLRTFLSAAEAAALDEAMPGADAPEKEGPGRDLV